MADKIFINYRRDDVPGDARGIREALVSEFGKQAVFMDVDNLLAGQRFDKELEKALAQCDALIAVMGPRWMELLAARTTSGERDYVREEIAAALKRGITVIPVRVGREGTMAALPRADQLPEDIRELVLHQKQDVAHERFGRDMVELVSALRAVRAASAPPKPWGKIAGGAGAALAAALAVAWVSGVMPLGPSTPQPAVTTAGSGTGATSSALSTPPDTGAAQRAAEDAATAKRMAAEKAAAEAAAKEKLERDAVDAKRMADEKAAAEKQRVAMLAAEEDKKRAEAARKTAAVPQPGETFRDCADVCPEMVVVPAGEFTMGSPESETERSKDEGPQHQVTIPKPFAVGKYEVTFAEWDACVAAGGCKHKPGDESWGRGKRPVINVSWDDVTKEYLPWLNKKTGKTYRLLTEAEWEYAARAGATTAFSTGKTITPDQANFDSNYTYGGSAKGKFRAKTIDVGSFDHNDFGLYDMHGNVWEWVQDCYRDSYIGAPKDGTAAIETANCSRVLRGGSWGSGPRYLRAAIRDWIGSGLRYLDLGFRVALSLVPPRTF
jgi:formylglycine-generating enzyme required for sulfatase activity